MKKRGLFAVMMCVFLVFGCKKNTANSPSTVVTIINAGESNFSAANVAFTSDTTVIYFSVAYLFLSGIML